MHRDFEPKNLSLELRSKHASIKIVDSGLSANFEMGEGELNERLGT